MGRTVRGMTDLYHFETDAQMTGLVANCQEKMNNSFIAQITC
jgi:hypothetical protein